MRRVSLSEHSEQSLVVRQLAECGVLYASIPNDGARTAAAARSAKQRGLVAGAPDLLVFTVPPAAPQYRGVALEFKKASGGHEDPKQVRFLARLREEGWLAEFVHGAPEALRLLHSLGYPVGVIQ
jgi:hypothetical protein